MLLISSKSYNSVSVAATFHFLTSGRSPLGRPTYNDSVCGTTKLITILKEPTTVADLEVRCLRTIDKGECISLDRLTHLAPLKLPM